MAEAMILDTEAAVIANFEFLGHTDMDMEEEEGDVEDEIYDANTDTKPNKVIDYYYLYTFIIFHFMIYLLSVIMCYIYYVLCVILFHMTFVFFLQTSMPLLGEDVDTDAEAEEVLNELNLLTEIEESPPGSIHLEMNSSEWSK